MLPPELHFKFKQLRRLICAGLICFAFLRADACAAGVFEDGASSRAQALGGASAAGAASPMDALSVNPAELAQLRHAEAEAGLETLFAHGDFRRPNDSSAMDVSGLKPKGAVSYPWGPVTLGAGFVPEAALRAAWRYRDAPGGLDGQTSYGVRAHSSELTLLRFALGAGYQIAPQLAIGASGGLLYNRNQLHAPYTIQSQPQLASAKVLLDLEAEGWGANANFGLTWKPLEGLELGLSGTLPSRLRTEGRAQVDASRQLTNLGLKGVDAKANFDSAVTNNFPAIVSLGAAWKATSKLTFVSQLDWIQWHAAFDSLDVRLQRTDNGLFRTLLNGQRDLDDNVPLRWRDQWVTRAGVEYALASHWTLRAGYRYARNPVPGATLTPLTAAIGQQVVSAGLGYGTKHFGLDLAWQWQLPASGRVAESALRSGEYSHSQVEIEVQSVSLTARVMF